MPAGPGAIDANGIYQYGEADLAAPVSDMLNLGQGSTSLQVAALRAALDDLEDASSDAWASYVPTLTATTSNPNLGTGSSFTGKFKSNNKVVSGWANIAAGSAGVTAGSGTYRISLPVTPVGATYVAGSAFLFDASSSIRYTGLLQIDVSGPLTFAVMTFNTMTSEWGSAGGPIILAVNDQLRVSFVYEAL
jgi:hypothetical protein